MFKLFFFTSSQSKLSNIRHLCRDKEVDILSFQEETYHANYNEPRIDDHKQLLQESFEDALMRWKKIKTESDTQTFFIEDTSVVIHALSDNKDIPGPDIKYWMRDADFDEVDKQLKERGNDRRVTVRSDILLYLPEIYRDDKKEKYAHFTSSVDGFFIDKEENFTTNLLYPWLDNKTFNKWFTPYEKGKSISTLSIKEADKYDFRKSNVHKMISLLSSQTITRKKQLKQQLTLDSFQHTLVFVLCGPTCTGKTTLAEYLSQTHGFEHIEASDFMHLAYYQRHGTGSGFKLIDFAKQALKDLPEIVASQIIEHKDKYSSIFTPLVISGFRNLKEIEWLRKNYLHSSIIPVYIDTEFEIRFNRCEIRKRDDHSYGIDKFKKVDEKQYGMGLKELESELPIVFNNNEGLTDLFLNFERKFTKEIKNIKNYPQKEAKKKLLLQDWILLSLLGEYKSKQYFTTTEISKLINKILPKGQKEKEKDNVSRYFNRTFHPYYEISRNGKFNKYRLSNTGYSLALQLNSD